MIKTIRNGVWIKEDGSEACLDTAAGRREYARRRVVKWAEQRGICAGPCGSWMPLEAATLDHIKPRGMGGSRRDDRLDNLQVMCAACNGIKGSRRI